MLHFILLIQRILMKKGEGTVLFYVSRQGDLESYNFYININSQNRTSNILRSVGSVRYLCRLYLPILLWKDLAWPFANDIKVTTLFNGDKNADLAPMSKRRLSNQISPKTKIGINSLFFVIIKNAQHFRCDCFTFSTPLLHDFYKVSCTYGSFLLVK